MRTLSAPLIVALVLGCSPQPPPRAAPPPPEAAPSPPIVQPPAPEGVGGLDSRGNLRPSTEVIHGFSLPLASAVMKRNPSVVEAYAESNIERLLRFYRSRGHLLIRTRTGWEIRHTPRTLRDLGIDGVTLGGATVVLRQGPGPGWTLRLDSGKARVLRRPALTELLAAEERYRDETAADLAGETAEPSSGDRDQRSDLRELKRRAFDRPVDKRRVRDLSRQIYEYAREHPEEGFID